MTKTQLVKRIWRMQKDLQCCGKLKNLKTLWTVSELEEMYTKTTQAHYHWSMAQINHHRLAK